MQATAVLSALQHTSLPSLRSPTLGQEDGQKLAGAGGGGSNCKHVPSFLCASVQQTEVPPHPSAEEGGVQRVLPENL